VCRGEVAARIAFQEAYGPLIYAFPVRFFHLPESDAGAFYLYAFEKERIFKRLQTFQGRNAIQFTTYLSFHVLRDLVLEWLRTREDVELLSLDTPGIQRTMADDTSQPLGQQLASAALTPEDVLVEMENLDHTARVLAGLAPENRLLLKILCLAEIDLEPDEMRLLARLSGRGISETMALLAEVQETVEQRMAVVYQRHEQLAAASHWIFAYQQRLKALRDALAGDDVLAEHARRQALQREQQELERKLAWRYRQQETLRREALRTQVCPPYKDIARLFNWRSGSVGTRIARARETLRHALLGASAREPSARE
jgi:DNA-directed RNA polymerase specialized sigma24 family protein